MLPRRCRSREHADRGSHGRKPLDFARGRQRGHATRQAAQDQPVPTLSARLARCRWATLIKRVYQVDPLLCPRCGGTMKIIAFIEAHQGEIIEKILRHGGLWQDPPSRGPPRPPTRADAADPDTRRTREVDPDYLEHCRQEQTEQLELPW